LSEPRPARLAQSRRTETSVHLSAFGAKRTYTVMRLQPLRTRMTRSRHRPNRNLAAQQSPALQIEGPYSREQSPQTCKTLETGDRPAPSRTCGADALEAVGYWCFPLTWRSSSTSPSSGRSAAAHAKLALRSAQAGERDDKIAQALLRGGNTSCYKHRSIPLTQTA
jgi:hypothetical protein